MNVLVLKDFDYELPRELIAAFPPSERPSARLLSVARQSGKFSHYVFRDMIEFLKPGDVLVLNNTKVIPARLFGKKTTGGKVEALLLREKEACQWQTLLRPGGRIKKGAELSFGENGIRISAKVLDDPKPDSGERLLGFEGEPAQIKETLRHIGHIPLPPYIDRPDSSADRELYQTVFAAQEGAVASPTAGLHFDWPLLKQIEKKGIEIVFITLHTSYGTFQPITEREIFRRQLFAEPFEITDAAAERMNRARAEKRRIIACGTTTVRALESAAVREGEVRAQTGETRLFIYPPYSFKMAQGIITNFHLPKSSLLMLVAAFLDTAACPSPKGSHGGLPLLLKIYKEAIRNQYRFYSYGDAMMIL